MTRLENVKKSIGTVQGEAFYIGTEIEDEQGRWSQKYSTRDGCYVIHEGKEHHVYSIHLKSLFKSQS